MRFVDSELDLHRQTVEEALPRLRDHLYCAFTSGMSSTCINHGYGSRMLRQAVHRELKHHSLVKSFRAGGYGEGGEGVTIVELADH
ncbi:Smr/MutS family protein [Chloroflexota bacterium]